MKELENKGTTVDPELGQEDHGWYFTFTCGEKQYDLIVGHRGDDWVGWIERSAGFVSSLLGGRNKAIDTETPLLIHSVLSSQPQITDIRWHRKKISTHSKRKRELQLHKRHNK